MKKTSECSVEELKRLLECHGQKKSGKKHEIVERVKKSLKLIVKVNSKMDEGRYSTM